MAMTGTELEEQDRALRAEADALLRRYALAETLGEFGRPVYDAVLGGGARTVEDFWRVRQG